mmetsp:Transcript_5096/g.22766  ORF Transcript_5096/g.22766 Transcript_5096/m.22766 type:complete len:366 (-) Transcript_5096:1930-3027(-)
MGHESPVHRVQRPGGGAHAQTLVAGVRRREAAVARVLRRSRDHQAHGFAARAQVLHHLPPGGRHRGRPRAQRGEQRHRPGPAAPSHALRQRQRRAHVLQRHQGGRARHHLLAHVQRPRLRRIHPIVPRQGGRARAAGDPVPARARPGAAEGSVQVRAERDASRGGRAPETSRRIRRRRVRAIQLRRRRRRGSNRPRPRRPWIHRRPSRAPQRDRGAQGSRGSAVFSVRPSSAALLRNVRGSRRRRRREAGRIDAQLRGALLPGGRYRGGARGDARERGPRAVRQVSQASEAAEGDARRRRLQVRRGHQARERRDAASEAARARRVLPLEGPMRGRGRGGVRPRADAQGLRRAHQGLVRGGVRLDG